MTPQVTLDVLFRSRAASHNPAIAAVTQILEEAGIRATGQYRHHGKFFAIYTHQPVPAEIVDRIAAVAPRAVITWDDVLARHAN